MDQKGLTATIVFQASSANYGESIGNISALKKMTRADGKQYAYISRQALRYNIVDQLGSGEQFAKLGIDNKDKSVIQFAKDATIEKAPEIDFFGYMKTASGKNATTRGAVVRLSNAFSQTPYAGDTDFLTNLGLVNRMRKETGDNTIMPNIAQAEVQNDFYVYTVTIDLDQIGIDENDEIKLSNAEKAKRVGKLLTTLQYLYRDIRGRREDLKPLFIIGGIYDIKSPVFENIVRVNNANLDLKAIQSTLNDHVISENTQIGLVDGIFQNDAEIKHELNNKIKPVSDFMNDLKKKTQDYYLNSEDDD